MATKLYFHASNSSYSNLPTDEQSSLTPDSNRFDNEDGTENRLMDTTIGTSQTSLVNTSTNDTNAHNYYIARWVSKKLNQTSIAANTWNYKFAAQEQNANANFPRNGAGVLHINCYVWRTSNGTKVGTILDGNSSSNFEEASTTETIIEGTFSGSAVSSINTNDDVIIFEAWAIVTQGMATAYTQTYFYDGTTESSTTSNAAHIETPETISFIAEVVTCTVTGKPIMTKKTRHI